MPLILNIESSSSVCSVALAKEEELLALQETHEPNNHATQLTSFIQKAFEKTPYQIEDVDAVAVSAGPGSYTGLRIGYSVAKGICYSLDKPLITISTLQALASEQIATIRYEKLPENTLIAPLIDARRMEVYSAIFDAKAQEIRPPKAEIITEDFFQKILHRQVIVFCGNGAFKVPKVIAHPNVIIETSECSAKNMIGLSAYKYKNTIFENVAYATPFYLKAPFITKPKSRL